MFRSAGASRIGAYAGSSALRALAPRTVLDPARIRARNPRESGVPAAAAQYAGEDRCLTDRCLTDGHASAVHYAAASLVPFPSEVAASRIVLVPECRHAGDAYALLGGKFRSARTCARDPWRSGAHPRPESSKIRSGGRGAIRRGGGWSTGGRRVWLGWGPVYPLVYAGPEGCWGARVRQGGGGPGRGEGHEW